MGVMRCVSIDFSLSHPMFAGNRSDIKIRPSPAQSKGFY
jgi:hypothetical protein